MEVPNKVVRTLTGKKGAKLQVKACQVYSRKHACQATAFSRATRSENVLSERAIASYSTVMQQIKKQCGGSVTVVFVDRADSTEAVAKITGPASAVLKVCRACHRCSSPYRRHVKPHAAPPAVQAKSKIEQAIASSSESSQSENCDEEPGSLPPPPCGHDHCVILRGVCTDKPAASADGG